MGHKKQKITMMQIKKNVVIINWCSNILILQFLIYSCNGNPTNQKFSLDEVTISYKVGNKTFQICSPELYDKFSYDEDRECCHDHYFKWWSKKDTLETASISFYEDTNSIYFRKHRLPKIKTDSAVKLLEPDSSVFVRTTSMDLPNGKVYNLCIYRSFPNVYCIECKTSRTTIELNSMPLVK
jgi:hypothetical protein